MKSIWNESQIERIADTVNKSNIASAEMKEDLIDHLCCIAEDEMSKGRDFETVYQTVLPKRLNEIQNETVFLFTSKSRKKLDRTMYVSGFIAFTGVLITVVMKILHLPFAQLALITTHCVILLVLFPTIIIRMMKQKTGKKRIPYFGFKGVLIHVGGLLYIVSAVFQIFHWPGSLIILLLATIFCYLAIFPLFFFKIFKKTR